MKTPKVHPIRGGGFSVRLRCGAGGHHSFRIAAETEREALQRAKLMGELSHLLVKAGRGDEAVAFVRSLGEATNDADARDVAAYARETAAAAEPKGEAPAPVTFRSIGQDWTSGKLASRYPDHVRVKRSASHDAQRLSALYETIGDVPVKAFTLADAKRAMGALPEGLRSGSRRHYGQVIARILKMAVWPLEIISASPLPAGFLPRVRTRSRPPLYPKEDASLLRCGAIQSEWRLFYGFMAREGLRLGEVLLGPEEDATGLLWRDIDLDVGAIRLDRSKNGARSWALRPDVVRALKAWRGDAKADALVFPGVTYARAAKMFREHLRLAGVDRSELFAETAERTQVCVHSLRATFVTVSLANGATETQVADRTGHASSDMINRYRQQARRFAELSLGPLGPLDKLIGCAADCAEEVSSGPAAEVNLPTIPNEFRCSDSNTDSGIQSPLSYP